MVSKEETYRFLHLHFKVYPLWQYAQKNLKVHRISLKRIAEAYGFKHVEGKTGHMTMFGIDPKHAANLKPEDYRQPLLIIKLPKEYGGLMIDGLHRAYRLWKQGQKTIRAYHIDDFNLLAKHSNIKIIM